MKLNVLFLMLICGLSSCKEYLDEVPDRSLAILTEVEQYQQLLDNQQLYMNAPTIEEIGADDFYWSYTTWSSGHFLIRNAYTWESDIYEGNTGAAVMQDWQYPYQWIYYANVTLDGLKDLKADGASLVQFNQVKGHALFMRAFQHYLLQEVFGQPFKPGTADTDAGIPLRLSSDLSEKAARATVRQTFERIISDLEEAAALLPSGYQEANRQRPSKAAAYALLSRVYLTMQDYESSLKNAGKCLDLYDRLAGFNELSPGFQLPGPHNDEVLFVTRQLTYAGFGSPTTVIDSALYASYDAYDLRKRTFFQVYSPTGTPYVKTLYSGWSAPFSGLATDEVYLNRAECRARLGDAGGALADLDHLLENRFQSGHFTSLSAGTPAEALDLVLNERRKELVFRGTRWSDLRRLNQDPRHAVTLRRVLNGKEYVLSPGSRRYTYPIPPGEIALSGLQQNER